MLGAGSWELAGSSALFLVADVGSWKLVVEVRDIPNSHPAPEGLAVIPKVGSCLSEMG